MNKQLYELRHSVSNPLSKAIGVLRKDWKLLAGLNALYFCVLLIGAVIALISPGFHLSMINYIGANTIAGSAGVQSSSNAMEALIAAGMSLISSLMYVIIIAVPSILMPLWGPIFGATIFFTWGVAYVAPLQGVMTIGNLLPQYLAMLLIGEAYIIAIFACVRQLRVAIAAMGLGFRQILKVYIKAVMINLNLLLIVIILLVIAALYQALVIPLLTGIL
jgi:hypothetical protein